jgi:NDP-sugar pyrophosphorylase family protein
MKETLLVMAAGMGSRYGGLKQMDGMGPNGETLMDYVLYDAIEAGFNKIVFIIRKDFAEAFREKFNHLSNHADLVYVFQESDDLPEGYSPVPERVKPWGTGHAVWTAKSAIDEPFAVINADDFYGREAMKEAYERVKEMQRTGPLATLIAYRLDRTLSDHGTVSRGVVQLRDDHSLDSIEENTSIERVGAAIVSHREGEDVQLSPDTPVSMNLMVLKPQIFDWFENGLKSFLDNSKDLTKGEYYLPAVLSSLLDHDEQVEVRSVDSDWFGVTYSEDKEKVKAALSALIEKGVYPDNLWN